VRLTDVADAFMSWRSLMSYHPAHVTSILWGKKVGGYDAKMD
jgi:hypothetical protein